MKSVSTLLLLLAGLPALPALGADLRDPFARPAPAVPAAALAAQAAAAVPPPPLRLRALILNGARSLANIDGDVVAVGDEAPGYTVLRIDARGVLVARGGRRELLVMGEPGQDRPRDKETE
ncbi:hypothetical protein [Pseudoduganella lutea]|uniref:MSHA biogenesis protein MshK n=1 Tax=Pseudoduganella lutea TaxID=321985 RepID=A0A4P6L279_9BURK|nr:hypothetical protein [Pseudoduganella lutea]QBE65454.1 hypothetical protein EWM63_22715 [Pseudoduganella lutea]